jgi:putative Mg2+ transporter-C (MgtC) family protein
VAVPQGEIIKILVALLVGGSIGLEREIHAKAAGLRTITLITLGSTLFTMISPRLGGEPNRMAANLVVGVGFLGAGVIMFSQGRLTGMTTAATIWVSAALGAAIGMGEFALAAVATGAVLVVLWPFANLDRWIDKRGAEVRLYEISLPPAEGMPEHIEAMIRESGLTIVHERLLKVKKGTLEGHWEVRGAPAKQQKFINMLLSDEHILGLKY